MGSNPATRTTQSFTAYLKRKEMIYMKKRRIIGLAIVGAVAVITAGVEIIRHIAKNTAIDTVEDLFDDEELCHLEE